LRIESATTAPPPRRGTWRRRLARDISTVMIVAGILVLIDAGLAVLWQEPLTALVGLVRHDQISQRYLSFRNVPMSAADRTALRGLTTIDQRIAFLARREQSVVPGGAAIGRISIPAIGVGFEVVQGTDTGDLERGPGHYASTAFPGLGQTVAIAGHRTTYLAPFRNINALKPGALITLQMPYATFVYKVQYHRITSPTAWWITEDVGYERLVLSACNPLYSAAQRIVVFAKLSSVKPDLAALRHG
jgi:sortase A